MRPAFAVNPAHLQEYVKSIASLPRFRADAGSGSFPFLTISRQTGAGGHTLAEAVIGEMKKQGRRDIFQGWQILDQDICRQVMDDPKLKIPLQWLLTEKFHKEIGDYLSQIVVGTSPQIAVFRKIGRLIRSFAAFGKVIVVGRAGSLLTRSLPLGIHVRLVASLDSRAKTMMRQFGLTRQEAEAQIREQDASRALLVETYFGGRDVNDPLLYDAVWNTDNVPIPSIAAFLVRRVEEKAASAAQRSAGLELGSAAEGGRVLL